MIGWAVVGVVGVVVFIRIARDNRTDLLGRLMAWGTALILGMAAFGALIGLIRA